jgi:hypothetical protein
MMQSILTRVDLSAEEVEAWGWGSGEAQYLRRVVCRKCSTLVAFRDVRDRLFHFFNALPSSA